MLDVHLLMGKKAVVSAERVRRSGSVVFFFVFAFIMIGL